MVNNSRGRGVFLNRRTFLTMMLAGGVAGFSGTAPLLHRAFAMGAFKTPAGMHRVKGDVKINGSTATRGSPVKPGDVVTTGDSSMAIFVVGKDVYLIRENTRVELESRSAEALKLKIADVLRIMNGKMLSVFGKGKKRLEMPTAVIGVRGTGVYVESEPRRTYYCNCYGTADIIARADPAVKKTVKTKHHEAPLFIYSSLSVSKTNQLIVKAPVFNHTDTELIMLERLVFRKPPFYEEGTGGGGGY